ncbi:MAG: phosphoesterase PA-phosphatase, partial [Stackebrandtia sp.]
MYTKPTIPRRSLFVTASALATGLVLSPRAFAAHGESDADVVAEWHDLTAATIAELKVSPPPTVNRAWAIAWLAAARAVKRVPHRIDDGDYRRAALA